MLMCRGPFIERSIMKYKKEADEFTQFAEDSELTYQEDLALFPAMKLADQLERIAASLEKIALALGRGA